MTHKVTHILLLASHAVAEYDDIRMFTAMGHQVFCPGGYQNPHTSGEGIRPAIPEAPVFPELIEACERVRREKGDPGPMIDWAKAALPDEVIEWADIIIAHHFVDRWVFQQWDRIKHKRVIWRTCGQSNPDLENLMGLLRGTWPNGGLQIVRYSPKERQMPNFAGEDALIRFGKFPDDYGPWIGDDVAVGNITQNMVARADACGYGFYMGATQDLPAKPAGTGSEVLPGGVGELSYPDMLDYLRHIRVFLYTGTVAAPYTLGLMEAMLTGTPVVSIGPKAWRGPEWLFEAHEIASAGEWNPDSDDFYVTNGRNDPEDVREALRCCLTDATYAKRWGDAMRTKAIDLFGIDKIVLQWEAFL